MANEITENQREKMRYRRVVMNDKLRELEQVISGRAESYLPLISDENGRVAKEKTERFVAEMLGALRRYVAYGPRKTLSEESLQMYESFLYCAVMSLGFEHSRRDHAVWNWKTPSVFEDIIRRAEGVEISGCGSYADYLADCYRAYRAACDGRERLRKLPHTRLFIEPAISENDSDFFIAVKRSLDKFHYPPFIECLPEETLNELCRQYENGNSETEAGWKAEQAVVPVLKEQVEEPTYNEDFDIEDHDYDSEDHDYDSPDHGEEFSYEDGQVEAESRQAYEDSLPEETRYALYDSWERNFKEWQLEKILSSLNEDQTYSDIYGFTLEEIRDSEKIKERNALVDLVPDWKWRFVFDEAVLCGHFYRFMRLYFDSPDRVFFVEDIENMVDTFLCEHGISAFSLGDNYAMVNYFVDRAKLRIGKELGRGKR